MPHQCAPLFAACLFLLLSGCSDNASEQSTEEPAKPLFNLLPVEQTGVDFENTLTEGPNTNILVYEYFYNGGGVATGDFNNDGLVDLYFTSNMGENKLYLNQGGMRFRDVTTQSDAAGRSGPWKTGVAAVDINGDSRLDLYLCYSGALPDPKRANQLFINTGNDENGVPRFQEQAAQYGLNSPAFSNQSYFFDYDRDGDLDMLLLNHNPKSLPILNEVRTAELLKVDDPLRGLRLFQQTPSGFVDVTARAGITGSPLSYGLGLGISDVNGDGWPDFYVSNDYAVSDYLYINNKDGTFNDLLQESFGHISQFSMGNDIADINNDGLTDIITLDMLPEDNRRQKLLMAPDNYDKFNHNVNTGFYYQYMRNMLQLNNGNGTFSEIGQLSGISNTDWSWAALLADYDNDGWKDLYVTNGYRRDYTNLDFINYMDSYVQSKGRLVRDEVLELIQHMPSSNVSNYMFGNTGGLTYDNRTTQWGVAQTANSNGAAYVDLDNDGDLDLVVNNINMPAFIYENGAAGQEKNHYLQVALEGSGRNTLGIGTRVSLWIDGEVQVMEQYLSRGYLSTVSPTLHFGLGDQTVADSLVIDWPDGRYQVIQKLAADQQLSVRQEEATRPSPSSLEDQLPVFAMEDLPFTHVDQQENINDFKRQPLLINELSFVGPVMEAGDLNSDGITDVVIGGSRGQATQVYIGRSNRSFEGRAITALNNDLLYVDADLALLDADADGDLDLYVASGGYHDFSSADERLQDRLYLNNGQGDFELRDGALPEMLISTGTVAVADINGDQYPDIFVGGRVIPGNYPQASNSYLLINDGQGNYRDETSAWAPELVKPGMVTDAKWTDLNNDNQVELILAGEWMGVTIWSTSGNRLQNVTGEYMDQPGSGFWNSVELADLNKDGRMDLILGNQGLNTQFRVSADEPAELYFGDFDNNGVIDPLFCFYIDGRSYPYVTRGELLQQLAVLGSRFTTFDSYANATLVDILTGDQLDQSSRLIAQQMETMLLLSQPDGRLKKGTLPLQAQYAPVHEITVIDYDQDGHQDMLLSGNNSHAKLRLGKFDANYGTLLRGDGKGNFEYINQVASGLQVKGDVRSVIRLDDLLLFGITGREIVAYRLAEQNVVQ